MKDNFVIDT